MKTSVSLWLVFGILLGVGGCANNIDDLVMCENDVDCPGGYCHDTDLFCVSGERQCLVDTDCTPPTTVCSNGQCVAGCVLEACDLGMSCNPATGRCRFPESCTIDSQCDPPDLVCEAGFCELGCAFVGCPDGFCDPYGGHCQGTTTCTGDGDCAPPASICEGEDCVAGCTVTGCTGTDQCNQISGRCVPDVGCTGDADCSPPSTICESPDCVAGCTATSCGVGEQCSTTTGRCEPVGGCTGDADCNPPSTICESPDCVAGCTAMSCGVGMQCSLTTGRCEPVAALLEDGEDCTATGNSQCLSGFCMTAEIYHNPNWVTFNVCSRNCCMENDCDLGFACLYHHGVKMCVPDDIYPPGFTFTQNASEFCGPTGPYCRSGFCNSSSNTCSRTCCESSHCGVDACAWWNDTATGYMFELCYGGVGLSTGAYCTGYLDCNSLICIDNQCADMCCSNGDCPGGFRCAQVLGQSTTAVATSACVTGSPGSGVDGASCVVGDAPNPQCQSGLCAGGVCRSPCCSDGDCLGGAVCLPVPSGFDINSDGDSDFVRACIP
jgi:hypothetical protein